MSLFPEGITSVHEVPWDLLNAIEHAMRVLSWLENITSDEMPPAWMLPFDDELEIWFERVDRERKEKYGGGADMDEPAGEMMGNEMVQERFGR